MNVALRGPSAASINEKMNVPASIVNRRISRAISDGLCNTSSKSARRSLKT